MRQSKRAVKATMLSGTLAAATAQARAENAQV
jgi:hypothetical protein